MKPEELPSRKFRSLPPPKHMDTMNKWKKKDGLGPGMKLVFAGMFILYIGLCGVVLFLMIGGIECF